MSDVLIWDSSSPAPKNQTVILWQSFNLEDAKNTHSILDLVDQNKASIRSEYLSWSHDLGELKIFHTTIKQHLEIRPNFSYWWLSLFVEKCNFSKSPQIDNAIKLIAFKQWLSLNQVTSIEVKSNNSSLIEALRTLSENNKLNFYPRKNSILSFTWPKLYSLKGMAWLLIHIYKIRYLRGIGVDSWRKTKEPLTFFSYLFNLDPKALKSSNHRSNFWSHLPNSIAGADYGINWLHIFTPSRQIPNHKIAAATLESFNQKNSREVHVFLESFISLRVILKSISDWRLVSNIASKLKVGLPKQDFILNALLDEWDKSFYGFHSISNCLTLNLFSEAMRSLPKQKLGLYLQENQSWELALNYCWKKEHHQEIIGVPHSTTRFWDLRYANDRRAYIMQDSLDYPKPDAIAINGQAQKNYFQSMDYPESEVILVEALRYFHLKLHSLNGSVSSDSSEQVLVLVLGDYLLENNFQLIQILIQASSLLPNKIRFIVKPHPACPIPLNALRGIRASISEESLEDLLQNCDLAYSSNVTTAALDAYFRGVPVACMIDPSKLNLSPMLEIDDSVFVKTPQELAAKILQAINSKSSSRRDPSNFFELDASLPKWLDLINKKLSSSDQLINNADHPE
jgi:surface carbohydrate biosynthesis protein (TIGR04326 family)